MSGRMHPMFGHLPWDTDGLKVWDRDGQDVALVCAPIVPNQSKEWAVARLITAAPSMEAALRTAAEAFENAATWCADGSVMQGAMKTEAKRVRAALAELDNPPWAIGEYGYFGPTWPWEYRGLQFKVHYVKADGSLRLELQTNGNGLWSDGKDLHRTRVCPVPGVREAA